MIVEMSEATALAAAYVRGCIDRQEPVVIFQVEKLSGLKDGRCHQLINETIDRWRDEHLIRRPGRPRKFA